MRDATPCSPWLESPVRTILTLLILAQEPTPSLIRKSVWIFKRRQSPLPTSDLWRLLAPAGEAKSSGPRGSLASADAELVEGAFRERLAAIEGGQRGDASSETVESPSAEPLHGQSQAFDAPETPTPETAVVRRRRVAAKTIRLRDKEHCKFVATLPCVVCGRRPAEAHHIRFAQPPALGRKVSDEYTVPVCRVHHRELHDYGDEASWWAGANVDPLPIALELWRRSRFGPPSRRLRIPADFRRRRACNSRGPEECRRTSAKGDRPLGEGPN